MVLGASGPLLCAKEQWGVNRAVTRENGSSGGRAVLATIDDILLLLA